jgi:hypothetical protein
VFARLQALFPGSGGAVSDKNVLPMPSQPSPVFLKVRIVTWNMHDAVPKVRRSIYIHIHRRLKNSGLGRPDRSAGVRFAIQLS